VGLHRARIGPHCLIGIGASVLNGVVMEEESIVAAGSIVSLWTHIPRRTLVMGAPATPGRALSDPDLGLIHRPTDNYVRLAGQYRQGAPG
jgi:carbonic anhydrase/acetyltransferase-like protein (isoleucine patch superfamily)